MSNLEERMDIISSIKYVDRVVIQDDLDKVKAWQKYRFDKLFSGDDWKNSERWQNYETELAKQGVQVVYFPYTKTVSSSKLQEYVNQVKDD